MLSRELERLNSMLREKNNENGELRNRIAEMEYEQRKIEVVKKENDDLRRNISEYK